MVYNLNLLHQGRLELHDVANRLGTDSPAPEQLAELREMLADPNALFLDHVREHEIFPEVGVRLDRAARSLGYRKEVVRTVADSNGRPMFEILRFLPSGPG
jgi:hypothetical protein